MREPILPEKSRLFRVLLNHHCFAYKFMSLLFVKTAQSGFPEKVRVFRQLNPSKVLVYEPRDFIFGKPKVWIETNIGER